MLILGLLLILGAAALGAGFVYDGREANSIEILGTSVETTAAGIFFSGVATMLLFLLGVWMVTSKMGRARRKRGERKASRNQQRESVAQLEADRTQLAAENERLSQKLDIRRDTTSTTTDGAPAAADETDLRPSESTSHSATGKHS